MLAPTALMQTILTSLSVLSPAWHLAPSPPHHTHIILCWGKDEMCRVVCWMLYDACLFTHHSISVFSCAARDWSGLRKPKFFQTLLCMCISVVLLLITFISHSEMMRTILLPIPWKIPHHLQSLHMQQPYPPSATSFQQHAVEEH